MNDYNELIERLTVSAGDQECLYADAKAAIEALQTRVAEAEDTNKAPRVRLGSELERANERLVDLECELYSYADVPRERLEESRRMDELKLRIAQLESRLEISPLHNVDGIMARDATIKLQDEHIAELEAERAEREKQEPVLWTSKKAIDAVKKFGAGCIYLTSKPEDGNDASLYTTQPVTAPVRLTDEDFARLYDEAGFDPNEMREAAEHMFNAIQSAVLRANGFKVEE